MKEKRTFINQGRNLEKKTLKELSTFFDRLKQLISNTNLLQNQNIKQLVCCTEMMLSFGANKKENFEINELSEPEFILELDRNKVSEKLFWATKKIDRISICRNCQAPHSNHRAYILPSYEWGIHNELEKLCHELLNLEHEDLKSLFSEIPDIKTFTFAPSFHELEKLRNTLTQDAIQRNETEIWQAFEILYRVEWASNDQLGQDGLKKNASRDFLRKKKPSYDDAQALRTAANLLGLNNLRCEVVGLVPAQKRTKHSFFSNRTILQQNLDKILRKIYQSADTSVDSDNPPFPHSIELKIEDFDRLRLFVEWMPGVIEVCHLHTFKDDQDSSRLGFITELIKKPDGNMRIRRLSNETKNTKEYLRRAGIDGIIRKLFFAAVRADQAHLNSQPLENATLAELKKLRAAIQELKTIRWEPDIKPQPRKFRI
jgi:hypothetical protein